MQGNVIVMPVRAGIAMTRRAVESALRQHVDGGVVLNAIDNGSTDGCAAYLRALNGSVILQTYARPQNLHRVWNQALRLAFEKLHVEHVLVINNDVVLRPDTYRSLLADGGMFVTGVGVDTIEGTYQANPLSRSPHPHFSCFLMRKVCWDRVGAFEESYYAYAGDCSYHVRMHRAGIDAHSIDLPFYHVGSGTLKSVDHKTRDEIQGLADADRATFEKQYGCAIGSDAYGKLFDPMMFGGQPVGVRA